MSQTLKGSLEYADRHFDRFIDDLCQFISFPSVTTSTDHIHQTVEWLMNHLQSVPLERVEVFETIGNPVVYAEVQSRYPDSPTVLIYGHYDVQPAEPVDAWDTDPYKATRIGDYIYGRGTSDMKGQLLACVSAIKAMMSDGLTPIKIKFLLEGNEETEPDVLCEFLPEHRDLLNADFSLNCDGGMLGPDQPTIVYGLRGGAISTIRISGPSLDIHDGLFGGVIESPIHVLSSLIAGFHDDGRVTLPGFYEKVRSMDEEERAELAQLPIDASFYLKSTGAPSIWGEDEFTPVERVGARPALTVTMFQAGSRKGAIPSIAEARVSMRLVPNQDPLEVHEQLKEYVAQNAPPTVTWEVEYEEGWRPSISDRMYAGNEALRQAFETVWRKKPYYHLDGGGIPVVGQLKQFLGMDSVVTGFSLPDDNIHGPNERIHLPTVRRGIESLIHFFHILSKE